MERGCEKSGSLLWAYVWKLATYHGNKIEKFFLDSKLVFIWIKFEKGGGLYSLCTAWVCIDKYLIILSYFGQKFENLDIYWKNLKFGVLTED